MRAGPVSSDFRRIKTSMPSCAPMSRVGPAFTRRAWARQADVGGKAMSVVGWARLAAVMVPLASMQAGAQPPKSVAFANVSVVPMKGNQVLPNHTVVITGDRITALGPAKATPIPEGATRVDGQGKYLMPGLAEMHGHIPPPTAPREFVDNVLFLYVATGVTTVRGMQGAPGQLDLREAAKRGEIVAPNLYLAGPQFSGASVK